MILKYAVGIDVDSQELEACIVTIDHTQAIQVQARRRFDNTPSGFKKLDRWIRKNHRHPKVRLVCLMEASGVYYEQAALWLQRSGYHTSVILATKARRYMEACGYISKTDKIDAQGLAQMGAEKSLPAWQPLSGFYMKLRELTRHLQRLKESKTRLTNQVHAGSVSIYGLGEVADQNKQMLALIEQQITETERAIKKHLASRADVSKRVDYMRSIKGVNYLTVAALLAETNGFALIENQRQLIGYAGYDVVKNESGQRKGRTCISKKGNARIRRAMYFPAINVITYQIGPFQRLYERTLARHGVEMKSQVAVQKKLLVILYTLWRKQEHFDPEYGQSTTETSTGQAA